VGLGVRSHPAALRRCWRAGRGAPRGAKTRSGGRPGLYRPL